MQGVRSKMGYKRAINNTLKVFIKAQKTVYKLTTSRY